MPPFGRYVAAGVAVGLTLAVVGVVESRAVLPAAILPYLLPVVLAATRWGRGPAIFASLVSVLGHDYFFVQPVAAARSVA